MPHLFRHRGAARTVSVALGTVLALALASSTAPAAAQDAAPRPPCMDVAPNPAYPAAAAPGTAPAVVQAWQAGAGPRWTPPACTGWTNGGYGTLVALSGRFHVAGGADQLLGRLGAASMLRGVRYWSTTDSAWRPLVANASALDGSDVKRRRGDFTAAELGQGRELYFAYTDARSSAEIVHRMRVLESGPDRIVIGFENVTPIRMVLVTLFQPGALQEVHILQHLSGDEWGYYGLSRTTAEGTSSLAGGHKASYVNRSVALYRFIAGVRTDGEPPMAP